MVHGYSQEYLFWKNYTLTVHICIWYLGPNCLRASSEIISTTHLPLLSGPLATQQDARPIVQPTISYDLIKSEADAWRQRMWQARSTPSFQQIEGKGEQQCRTMAWHTYYRVPEPRGQAPATDGGDSPRTTNTRVSSSDDWRYVGDTNTA